ncbi:MAG: hypothetical protein IAE98_07670 [Candidatus Kapabacteria bacterium]|jgi:hypothetical protein|nr:hypothetical protein [Candidatus Kapabacteria bacterium]
MKEKYHLLTGIVLLAISLLLCFYLGRSSKHCNEFTSVITKRDTVIIVKQAEPITIEKARTKLIFKRDTIIETKPFTAIIDTIIKRDTVYAKFDFPENSFDLWIKKKPDSTMVHTIYITKEIVKERPWWEAPAFTLGGTIVGYVISKSFGKD